MGNCKCSDQQDQIENENLKTIVTVSGQQQNEIQDKPKQNCQEQVNNQSQNEIQCPQLVNSYLRESKNSEHLSNQLKSQKNPIVGSWNSINESQQENQNAENCLNTQSFLKEKCQ